MVPGGAGAGLCGCQSCMRKSLPYAFLLALEQVAPCHRGPRPEGALLSASVVQRFCHVDFCLQVSLPHQLGQTQVCMAWCVWRREQVCGGRSIAIISHSHWSLS